MKMGTMARIANLCLLVVIAILLAGPAVGIVQDVINGKVTDSVEMGIEADYDLSTMDEVYLAGNFDSVLKSHEGPLTVVYGGTNAELNKDNYESLAETIIRSGSPTASVKDAQGETVIQQSIIYGNDLMMGYIMGVKVGSLTDGLNADPSINFVGDGYVIPVKGDSSHKNGRLVINLEIPRVCVTLANATSGKLMISLDMEYMSTVTVLADVDLVRYDSVHEVVKINNGFRVDVTGPASFGDYTTKLGSDVNVTVSTNSDGYSIVFTTNPQWEVSRGIEHNIQDYGLNMKCGYDEYNLSPEAARGLLDLIIALEEEME